MQGAQVSSPGSAETFLGEHELERGGLLASGPCRLGPRHWPLAVVDSPTSEGSWEREEVIHRLTRKRDVSKRWAAW